MNVVTLPRWVLAALAAALAAALLAVAFLLGRASVVPEAQVLPPRPARIHTGPHPEAQPAPAAAPEPAAEVTTAPPGQAVEPVLPIVAGSSPAPGPTPDPGQPVDSATAGPVAAYFARIDRIQGAGGLAGGQEGAQRMLMATLQGDSSELDRLVAETERTRRELGTVQPPAECAAYHATLLRLMGDSGVLLADLRAALASGDSAHLAELASKASALQTGTERLQDMEEELRRRHGLPDRGGSRPGDGGEVPQRLPTGAR
ncbi:MAG: hypothetical protein MUF10_09770 [Thermoanaerobaculaceae bacterium]|jgi:hypothetical protein|nr:hypothetical protein [Thermoanaerobaculaceae bacterium]